MADVTGPISTLPGSYRTVPEGMTCDGYNVEHEDPVKATYRIQGETDSFGSEMMDLCDSCHELYKIDVQKEREELNTCEWCKTPKVTTFLTRDIDEGSCGPVYNVCQKCRREQSRLIQEELNRY